jgi:hypothetical protein
MVMILKRHLVKIQIFVFFVLFCSISPVPVEAKMPRRNVGTLGEVTLHGRIIEINEDHRFVIINLGASDGIKKGMTINVFQGETEVGKIKVSKVRGNISACDIQLIYAGAGMKVGDLVVYRKPAKPVELTKKMLEPLISKEIIEVEPIVIDIDAPKATILAQALKVFREYNIIVTESDVAKHTFKAHKNFDLPLDIGFFNEYRAPVRNKIFYSVVVTTTPRYNRLVIYLRGVYDSEGKFYNHEIKKASIAYKETQAMGIAIKNLAERL